MITIVDYDTGNLRSVQNMLKYLGFESRIGGTPDSIEEATKLILPGVGKFDFGMESLRKRGLIDLLKHKAEVERVPVLGICLGAQLLTRGSEEGELPGLGLIDADTRRFDSSKMNEQLRIPHMGWADTEFRKDAPLFANVDETPRYYYVHSYHMVCDNDEDELCHAYHGYRFVAGVHHKNVGGVQFHPEKSHRFGANILKNFASMSECQPTS